MRASLIAALAGAMLLCAGPARAWTGLTPAAPFPFWGSMPVKYYINPSTFPPSIAATAKQRLDAGFASWSGPGCTYFETQNMGDAKEIWNSSDFKNVLLWTSAEWHPEWGSDTVTIGITIPTWQADGTNQILTDADIVFNDIKFCWYDHDPQKPVPACAKGTAVDTQSIATHEQGHFLGLGHTDVQAATMFPTYSGGNDAASLDQDDIDGVCALYPVGGTTVSTGGVSCDACKTGAANGPCAAQTKACTGACLGLYNCVIGCATMDDACVQQCSAKYPDGAAQYMAYATCVCGQCKTECVAACGGAGAGAGSTGAWGGDEEEPEGPQITDKGGCGCDLRAPEGRLGALAGLGMGLLFLARRRARRKG